MNQTKHAIELNQSLNTARFPEASIDVDLKKYIQLGWWIIIGGLGSFLLWAFFAPLDKGVPLTGTVSVATNRKAVQHETGGTVEAILVKDGDHVKAGDTLIRMNNIHASSEAESARVQYITARAMQARLSAERDGKSIVAFPKELEGIKNDARILENITLQKQISNARQSALKSELSAIDENIAGLLAQIQGYELSFKNKQDQKDSINQQLQGMRDLSKEGYVATNRVLELEQNVANIEADMATYQGNIGRSKRQVSELTLQKNQRNQEYQKEVRTQLSDVQKQADALENQLKGLDHNMQNIEVKAPVTGTVVGLSVFTKGAVVSPGFKLMEIVPEGDSLVIEGKLPVHLVDKVYPDLPVNVMFTAFNRNITPHIAGVVLNVSADKFVDEHSGESYYKVISKVTPEGMKDLKDLKVRPGMQVDMFIKTGERTMMNYLFKPIFDRLKLSMSEE